MAGVTDLFESQICIYMIGAGLFSTCDDGMKILYTLCRLSYINLKLNCSFPGCSGAQLRSTGGSALVPNGRIKRFRREIRCTERPYRPGWVTYPTVKHNSPSQMNEVRILINNGVILSAVCFGLRV